jgi:hypothetical protein
VNFIDELRHGGDPLYRETGRRPTHVYVPRWRQSELIAAVADLPFTYCTQPIDCDCHFVVAGLKGHWWDRDYIEYHGQIPHWTDFIMKTNYGQ